METDTIGLVVLVAALAAHCGEAFTLQEVPRRTGRVAKISFFQCGKLHKTKLA